jgi:hypothetical protein
MLAQFGVVDGRADRPDHLRIQQEAGGQADGTSGGWKQGDQP